MVFAADGARGEEADEDAPVAGSASDRIAEAEQLEEVRKPQPGYAKFLGSAQSAFHLKAPRRTRNPRGVSGGVHGAVFFHPRDEICPRGPGQENDR
jgi:hypothetical protein